MHKIEILKSLCSLTQEALHEFLYDFLLIFYSKEEVVKFDGQFLYAAGDTPIGLAAHLDTAHKKIPDPSNIFYDPDQQVMWSPTGIGGDDRCGVFIIMSILLRGYRPHIIFTWNEEIGGLGARTAANVISPDLNFVIQFDRKGYAESVYYELDDESFESYINSFGFKTESGTYTDICEICPAWGCAGVNLSAGYQSEHTNQELILLKSLQYTLEKACEILEDQAVNPIKYKYVGTKNLLRQYTSYYEDDFYSFDRGSKYHCYSCRELNSWSSMNDYGTCEKCFGQKQLVKNLVKESSRW